MGGHLAALPFTCPEKSARLPGAFAGGRAGNQSEGMHVSRRSGSSDRSGS